MPLTTAIGNRWNSDDNVIASLQAAATFLEDCVAKLDLSTLPFTPPRNEVMDIVVMDPIGAAIRLLLDPRCSGEEGQLVHWGDGILEVGDMAAGGFFQQIVVEVGDRGKPVVINMYADEATVDEL